MFKKVLIAEDYEVYNLGITKSLEDLGIRNFTLVHYCDEALKEIKSALSDKNPYDLLITDLSFDTDGTSQHLKSGEELITAAKSVQNNLKVIVFSVEKKGFLIDRLYENVKIDGFVSKGRNDAKILKETIQKVYNGEVVEAGIVIPNQNSDVAELSDYDIALLHFLSQGLKQQEISAEIKNLQMKPDSVSSIEKKLNDLRDVFQAKNNIEMILICKELGII